MLFNTPKLNQFDVLIPKNWFNPNILKSYDKYIKYKNGHLKDMYSVLCESIVSITIGSVGSEPIETSETIGEDQRVQQIQRSKQGIISAYSDRTFTITFRHIDGYLNYFLMMYQSLFLNSRDTKENENDFFVLNIFDSDGNISTTLNLKGVIIGKLDPLELSKARTINEFETFDISFAYKYPEQSFHIPTEAETC